jgi:hypothetical protein
MAPPGLLAKMRPKLLQPEPPPNHLLCGELAGEQVDLILEEIRTRSVE